MPVLQVKAPLVPVADADKLIGGLSNRATLEDEIDAMVEAIESLDPGQPDQIMSTCMALMARCTELYLKLVRIEAEHRKAKMFRTVQLQKVMDLIDFQFRGASRLIEVRRQEIDLSK